MSRRQYFISLNMPDVNERVSPLTRLFLDSICLYCSFSKLKIHWLIKKMHPVRVIKMF